LAAAPAGPRDAKGGGIHKPGTDPQRGRGPEDLDRTGVPAPQSRSIHRGGPKNPTARKRDLPMPLLPQEDVGLREVLPDPVAIHVRQYPPEGGIGSHQVPVAANPPSDLLPASLDPKEADTDGDRDETEPPSDGRNLWVADREGTVPYGRGEPGRPRLRGHGGGGRDPAGAGGLGRPPGGVN